MTVFDAALVRMPRPVRSLLEKHRELLRFATVGGITFLITNVVNYALKLTVLHRNPVTALAFGVVVATIVSYVLNREWSFNERGGRERHHEAALFFLISGIGVGLNAAPEWVSRYMLHLETPYVSLLVQEASDYFFGMILGTLITMAFRWWAFRKWVFPHENVRPARPVRRLRAVEASDTDSEQVA